ncbi:phosphoketolase family protein [Lactobacillus sp. CC-MHH1034]|uniref:phosphoketolase family protein n=1 Tax=Agrilactobacillus fermenti TaxID=2586909 RepID=UPI001E379BC8|nr:phosphoketolase family protein [Agrilactobacillus fermenti]MCD2257089.1 phosphoketolase family protein [Agrilactobacillus fermenti]
MSNFDTDDYLEQLDRYFRAANYLCGAMSYLDHNVLLNRPLVADDVKVKPLGHFGTIPGQNLIYTHINRLINKYQQQVLVLQGPGHGGAVALANAYLNDDLVKINADLDQSLTGLETLCQQFAVPFGFSSHPEPAVPGAIHPGGELGYVLAHAFGAVIGHQQLLTVAIIGDGEAETGPLQASWQANTMLGEKDGKVLPIVTLNGLTMENTSWLAHKDNAQLKAYFQSLGYQPLIVHGKTANQQLHRDLAAAMDQAMALFKKAQWPVIILQTPKGMTGPEDTIGTLASHRLPIVAPKQHPSELEQLTTWLNSYHPADLFDAQARPKDMTAVIPEANYHVSDNRYTNRVGLAPKVHNALAKTALQLKHPGQKKVSNLEKLNQYLAQIAAQNPKPDQLLVLSPDEAASNDVALKDHLLDQVLSEHLDEGLLEGFLQTGGSGVFVSYEGFLPIVSSMVSQHLKWLTQGTRHAWRKDINALNLIGTSTLWEQNSNGLTHQNPELLNTLAAKNPELVRLYLPVDVNTTLVTFNDMIKTHQKVNYLITPKHPVRQWFTLKEAQLLKQKGLDIVDWASDTAEKPDIIFAAAGCEPFEEVLAATTILKQELPKLNIRVINILDLLRLQHPTINPRGLTEAGYNKLFTKQQPIIFNFHGYPLTLQGLLLNRQNQPAFINGYHEEGSVTTPFDLRVQNSIDRFTLVKQALIAMHRLDTRQGRNLFKQMTNQLIAHNDYVASHQTDLPEIDDWQLPILQSKEK